MRLRSSQPLASNSRLQIPIKFSSGTSSPLNIPLLPRLPPILAPLSTGITAATFQTSFSALAFNVATPRSATTHQHKIQNVSSSVTILNRIQKFVYNQPTILSVNYNALYEYKRKLKPNGVNYPA